MNEDSVPGLDAVREPDGAGGVDDGGLSVAPAEPRALRRDEHGRHAVPDLERTGAPRRGPDRGDGPRHFRTGCGREVHRERVRPRPHLGLAEVDAGGFDRHENLARAGLGVGGGLEAEDLGRTGLGDDDGIHGGLGCV